MKCKITDAFAIGYNKLYLRINNQQHASSIQNFILSRNATCFGHLLEQSSCEPDSPRQRPHNLHETYQLPRVQLITPDDGHSRWPKHVDFRDKIKFWIFDESCWLFIRRLSRCTATWTWSKTNYISYINMLRVLSRLPGNRLINSTYNINLINKLYFSL